MKVRSFMFDSLNVSGQYELSFHQVRATNNVITPGQLQVISDILSNGADSSFPRQNTESVNLLMAEAPPGEHSISISV